MATQTPKPLSYCVVCDAVDGDCGHQAARYLQDIVYEPGPMGGWIVPDSERERWDAAPLRTTAPPKPNEAERDVDELIGEINDSFYIDAGLESQLRLAHALDPLRVSRLVAAALAGAADGSLHTPRAFLGKRVAEIERSKTKAP